ncbi:MAG: serine/threonine protein kinase [Planctomycetes bacterium]|nr:serine/threonine protein kinase [Planctomycetota bacterium]
MQKNDREADLTLGRRAVRLQLLRGPDLVRGLLEQSQRRLPFSSLLVDLGLLFEEQIAQVGQSLIDDPPGVISRLGPGEVGEVHLGVRCERLLDQAPGLRLFLGRREQEPVTLTLLATDSIREGLWVDALETARAQQRLAHPNLLDVLDVGWSEAGGFMILQRHEPRSTFLGRLLQRIGRLKLSEAIRVGREVARGLGALHSAGLVHRGLNAKNVVLLPGGGVRVRNAGLCFRPEGADEYGPHGLVFGDPHYMAPECLAGDPPNPASDIYALGVLFYEMATGTRPFEGESLADLAPQQLELPPVDPSKVLRDLPPEVFVLCQRALAKDPSQRPGAATLATQFDTLEAMISRSGLTMKFQAHRPD